MIDPSTFLRSTVLDGPEPKSDAYLPKICYARWMAIMFCVEVLARKTVKL